MKTNNNEDYVTIKINKCTHELLKYYKKKYGIPINFTVDEAVHDYLKKYREEKEK